MDAAAICAQIESQGYCILEGLLDPVEARRLDGLARPLMAGKTGYVKLEGALNFIPELAPLCMHPIVLEVAERFWGKTFYLANNVCMMWCQPGAPGGGLHSDWPLGDVPQPYPPWPMLLQTMWMLTDFSEENGSTRVVPGSHRLGRPPRKGSDTPLEHAALGRQGSILIWHGGTWHRNGANTTTDQHRMGANIAYIPKFIHRPREAWPLLGRGLYSKLPERLKQILERSVAD